MRRPGKREGWNDGRKTETEILAPWSPEEEGGGGIGTRRCGFADGGWAGVARREGGAGTGTAKEVAPKKGRRRPRRRGKKKPGVLTGAESAEGAGEMPFPAGGGRPRGGQRGGPGA